MTRRLVLTNEAARHPFRQMLPPPPALAPVKLKPLAPLEREPLGPLGLFTLTFAAAFLAFSSYLA